MEYSSGPNKMTADSSSACLRGFSCRMQVSDFKSGVVVAIIAVVAVVAVVVVTTACNRLRLITSTWCMAQPTDHQHNRSDTTNTAPPRYDQDTVNTLNQHGSR